MNGLEQFFGHKGSIIGQQLGLQAFNQQQDLGAMQGAGELQKLFQAEQMNPLKLQEQTLRNQTEQAQLPGVQAQSELLGQNARIGRETLDNKISSTNSRFMQDMDDDQLKLMHNMAQRMAYDPNPEVRKAGVEMMEQHADVLKEKSKQKYVADRQLELERLRGSNSMAVARENNTTRLNLKTADAQGKPLNMSQLEAQLRENVKNNPNDVASLTALVALQQDKVERATAATQTKQDFTGQIMGQPPAPKEDPKARYVPPAAAPAAPSAAPGPKAPPTVGEVRGGYRFKGGNPADKNNWEKQ